MRQSRFENDEDKQLTEARTKKKRKKNVIKETYKTK